MTISTNDPVQTFIEIRHKVDEGHDYTIPSVKIDFQRLLNALEATIRENSSLKAQIASNQALLQEQDITIFVQSLEIDNFNSQTEQKDK